MAKRDKDFKFFIDDISLEKAKDKDGNDVMKIGGIASTIDTDSDGESIDPTGFDVSYFLDNGFFNYNHQAKFNPEAVVGEPTVAEVRKDGLYLEGFLYPESDLAKSIYKTTKMLKGSSSNRRMGFSIEGQAIERDPFNGKKIKKAKLTGCAITLNPKNPNTLVNILKGEYHEDDFEIDMSDVPTEVVDTIEKANEYLIHLEKDGKTIKIDKDLNVEIKETDNIDKALSVAGSSEIVKESVDQGIKKVPKVKGEVTREDLKNLSKGQAYSYIFNYISNIDLEKANLIIDLAKSNSKNGSQMKQTSENLNQDTLTKEGLDNAISEIEKAMSNDIEQETVKTEEVATNDEIVKSEDHDKEDSDDVMKSMHEDEEYKKLKKALDEYEHAYKKKMEKGEDSVHAKEETMQPDPNAASIGKEGEFMNKSVDADNSNDELIKGIANVIGEKLSKSHEDLVKSLNDSLATQKEENENLSKSIDAIEKRIQHIENTPVPSKTVTSDNYKEHPFEKSMDASSNRPKVSISSIEGKQQILDILDRKSGLDTPNPDRKYMQAMQMFESNNYLDKSIMDEISKSENIDIIG